MRKMMNKKGFTLVELMIVVVILGILVAIAVPIYSAVTENAKRKACQGNIRIIRSNMASYVMTGGDDGGYITSTAAVNGSAMYDCTVFKGMFDNNEVPVCKASGQKYVVTFQDSVDKFSVKCSADNGKGSNQCPNGQSGSEG